MHPNQVRYRRRCCLSKVNGYLKTKNTSIARGSLETLLVFANISFETVKDTRTAPRCALIPHAPTAAAMPTVDHFTPT